MFHELPGRVCAVSVETMRIVNTMYQQASTQERIPTMSKSHISDKYIQDHLKNVREEMAWRRELEFRLLQFLVFFYPVIGTAMVTLFQSNVSSLVFWLVAIGASILIIVASSFVTERISHEHFSYAELGRQVQKIWAYFGFFEPGAYIKGESILPDRLKDPSRGYGQGPGYKRTIRLIWLITVSMILTFLALAVIKSF